MSTGFRDGKTRQVKITNGLILYYHNYSYYSQKVLMALYEKNLTFEPHVVNIAKGGQYDSWFLKLNPRGEVPVLQDTGKIIPDSNRIIDYLEDNFSNGDTPRLIPIDQGPAIKQRVHHFRNIIDQLPIRTLTVGSLFHVEHVRRPKLPFVGPARCLIASSERDIGNTLRKHAQFNADAKEVLLEKANLLDTKNSELLNKDNYAKVLEQFEQTLDEIESELASHCEQDTKKDWWLCTDRFTVADVGLAVLLERLSELGYESFFWKNNKRPNIENYYTKVKQRSSYKAIVTTPFFHIKMFFYAYQTTLVVGLGISVITLVAFTVGRIYLRK